MVTRIPECACVDAASLPGQPAAEAALLIHAWLEVGRRGGLLRELWVNSALGCILAGVHGPTVDRI